MIFDVFTFRPDPPPLSFAGSARTPPSLLVDMCINVVEPYGSEIEVTLKDLSTYAIMPFRKMIIESSYISI
jgi:hypothetical protein